MSKLWRSLGIAAALTTLVPLRVDVDREKQEKTFRSLLVKASVRPNAEGGTSVTFDFGFQNPFTSPQTEEPVPVEVMPMDTPETDDPTPEAPVAPAEGPTPADDAPGSPSLTDEEASWYADLSVEEAPAENQKELEETP